MDGATTAGAVTAKSETTRAAIYDAALALFAEHGYDDTTMRAIAQRAGTSLGNSYYYFPSKEHLVQEFYRRLHTDHLAACEPLLERETDLRKRLRLVLTAHQEVMTPYHQLAGTLVRLAGDPRSPLSPFSAESAPVRDAVIDLFERVITGSRAKIPAPLAKELPLLLWTYQMGIVLFWVYDRSPGQRRTQDLIEETTSLVVKLIGLSRIPVMRTTWRSVIKLVTHLKETSDDDAAR
jgi:AcrR family transcriptional regulator